ncbi:MAG: trypsin-like peptidase domain-containing protein [Actinomycetota bacterium]
MNEREAMDAYSSIVTSVADRVIPSVASVRVMREVPGGRVHAGAGSAVAITPDGFAVTSAHVVQGSAGGSATFSDGHEAPYDVVGTDPLSDLAVVRVHGASLIPATLGDASTLRVGQLVVAVGNPLGFEGSVTAGVVSALGRSLFVGGDPRSPRAPRSGRSGRIVENVIQTDAALHPGNSGGALVGADGDVVGINTAVVGPGIGQGLGLAVPIDATTRAIITTLMSDGRVRRAYLGVAGGARPLPPKAAVAVGRTHGFEIVEVPETSPASEAGLRPGDIVLSLGPTSICSTADMQRLMTGDRIDRDLPVTVWRNGSVIDLQVTLRELEVEPAA